ncbi:M20/M25/M40 family metallo-hydrolase [Aureibaculum sp. 2210JD6-5]|uniref:M20/M25/M40 family metallo-hydrolase n=1 Tax=Aureibaculum sp. 2210JD6-5 TaxID=3103957 RepID=UPI002AAE2525|nr:M20/M25/M40 family metallo-hydrolase [Aureibaculum sp. 2210JD6-5]MDY7394667.1 M20/M25/M40 family metallo-hydrolase [Aureibaculum sp. 2210JD6-5]
MKKNFLFVFLFCGYLSFGQSLTKEQIKRSAEQKFPEAIVKLKRFLEIPNDGHFPAQTEANLAHCNAIFKKLDFNTQTITTDGVPILFAEKMFHKKAKTVLFYLQIDGQPVDTSAWHQENPFKPVLKEKVGLNEWKIIDFPDLNEDINPDWRIFARSASDSKGPAMSFISALEILHSKKIKPAYNVKVIMDFQEEMGSPTLPQAVTDHKELLKADMVLIMDGTRHVSNLPTLTYGARGIATAKLKVFGPRYALHSGQYGNFAPNPVFETAKLLGGLKDESGRVTLPGFYDGITLSDKEKQAINNVPEHLDSIKKRIGVAKANAVGNTYQEALQYPSLNVRGLNAGWVGEKVRTIIPAEVMVEIDIRLVPESDGKRLMELLKSYIQDQGYHLVDSIPTEKERQTYPKLANFTYKLGSRPFRTEMDSPIGHFLNKAHNRIYGENIVNMRTTGGSQPMAAFIETLGIPAVSVRIPNPDNNIHSPNENFRLGNFLEGIETCLVILDEPIKSN